MENVGGQMCILKDVRCIPGGVLAILQVNCVVAQDLCSRWHEVFGTCCKDCGEE